MKFLEFDVPVSYNDPWLQAVRRQLRGYGVKWQGKSFFITVLGLEDVPDNHGILYFLPARTRYHAAPSVAFDHLEAYISKSGKYIYVALAPSQPSEQLSEIIDQIRSYAQDRGCTITNTKRMSVSIGRISAMGKDLISLQQLLKTIQVPVCEYRIYNARYIDSDRAGEDEVWTFFDNEDLAEEEYRKEYLRHFRNACSNIQLSDSDL